MVNDTDFFTDREKGLETRIDECLRTNRRLSILRLVFFVLALGVTVAVFLMNTSPWLYLTAVIPFVVFIMLCVKHNRSKRQLDHLLVLKDVNSRYIARINGDFKALPDKGNEFADTNHDYALDLDLFGDVSLYALYNISQTAFGRKGFADALKGERFAPVHNDISAMQDCVRELTGKRELLQEFEATAIEGRIGNMPDALLDLAGIKDIFPGGLRILRRLLPLLWLVPILLAFIGSRFAGASILLIAVINLIVWFFAGGSYAGKFKAVDGIARQTEAISRLFLLLENNSFSSDNLRLLIKGGATDGQRASEGLGLLSRACALAGLRKQPLFALIINALYQYDLYCADKLISWADMYGEQLRKSIECLTEFEILMCAAVPGIISRESVFPEIVSGEGRDSTDAFFEGENITHPLLDPEKAVSNSIRLRSDTALITGSNMSGKTTLIRTVGICAILAYIGAPVPATSVRLGKMRVVSSMRIVDSIEEQMSTFKAELVRIGRIIEASKTEEAMLFLIDEIFRGTNSADRTEGALTVLKNLDRSHITGLMTTHDYALCDKVSESIDSIVYYHFSEKYNDQGITFDYKLHDGISHESNARFLMKLVGIE